MRQFSESGLLLDIGYSRIRMQAWMFGRSKRNLQRPYFASLFTIYILSCSFTWTRQTPKTHCINVSILHTKMLYYSLPTYNLDHFHITCTVWCVRVEAILPCLIFPKIPALALDVSFLFFPNHERCENARMEYSYIAIEKHHIGNSSRALCVTFLASVFGLNFCATDLDIEHVRIYLFWSEHLHAGGTKR